MNRQQALWLAKGVGGLLLTGLGLCVFGEAVSRKIAGFPWFWVGTASLAIFNFGLCVLFDSFRLQLQNERRR